MSEHIIVILLAYSQLEVWRAKPSKKKDILGGLLAR
jgi:hypothetical protein